MNGKKNLLTLLWRDKYLIILSLPAVLLILVFNYLPIFGLTMAFQNFQINKGFFGSSFVGLKYFLQFFQSMFFPRLVRNTFLISIYSIVTGVPIAIIFALLLNEVHRSLPKRIFQSISYFPYFISTVVVVGILTNLLNTADGVVNTVIQSMGYAPIPFMTDARYFRSVYVISGVWQTFGWNSIIYLGAINGIDPGIYEAASIDGANRFKRVLYITLPELRAVFITVLLLSLGNILNVGFEKIYLMYSPSNYETADVIATYVFRKGITETQYSFAAAVGFFNSVINTTFILIANMISRRTTGVYLW